MNPMTKFLIYLWCINIAILLLLILAFTASSSTQSTKLQVVSDKETGCEYLVRGSAMYPRLEPGTRKHLCISPASQKVVVEIERKK